MKKLFRPRELSGEFDHLYTWEQASWMLRHPDRSGLEPAMVEIAGQRFIDRDILNYLIYSQDSFVLTGE